MKYTFNSNLSDESFNNIDATPVSITYVGSYQTNALTAGNFNGTNAYAHITTNNTIKRAFPISIAFWINFTNDGEVKHLFKSDPNTSNELGYWVKITSSNAVEMGFGDGGLTGINSKKVKTSSQVLQENTWQHVVCIFRTNGDMDIFIDCLNAGGTYTGFGSNSILYDSYSSQIGRDYFSGTTYQYSSFKIDDLTFYSRELIASEVNLFCDPSSEIEEETKSVLNIYPNPTSDNVFIENTSNEIFEVSFFDIQGNKRKYIQIQEAKSEFDLSDLNEGLYILTIQTKNNEIQRKSLIIRR